MKRIEEGTHQYFHCFFTREVGRQSWWGDWGWRQGARGSRDQSFDANSKKVNWRRGPINTFWQNRPSRKKPTPFCVHKIRKNVTSLPIFYNSPQLQPCFPRWVYQWLLPLELCLFGKRERVYGFGQCVGNNKNGKGFALYTNGLNSSDVFTWTNLK